MAHYETVPQQLTSIGLRNFRGFKRADAIPLAPLTFLVGPNSSGKSSIIDALLLLAQSRFGPVGSFRPRWQGELVDLGSYDDTVYGHKSSLAVQFEISTLLPLSRYRRDETEQASAPFTFQYQLRGGKSEPRGILRRVMIRDDTSGEEMYIERAESGAVIHVRAGENVQRYQLSEQEREAQGYSWQLAITRFLRHMSREQSAVAARANSKGFGRILSLLDEGALQQFLAGTDRVSSGRGGPDRWYSLGRSAAKAINLHAPTLYDTVDPAMMYPTPQRRNPTRRSSSRSIVDLATVLRDLDIADWIKNEEISPYHSAIKVRDSTTGIVSNLMEVGYGTSQVIPVVRACLADSVGPLFVEQPEIHLHPKAQGTIADLLFSTSLHRQTIVETHSVRVINRARIQVARQVVPAEHVMILYVDRVRGGSRVRRIPLSSNGDFAAEWPDGFFDERFEDTMELLRLRHSPE